MPDLETLASIALTSASGGLLGYFLPKLGWDLAQRQGNGNGHKESNDSRQTPTTFTSSPYDLTADELTEIDVHLEDLGDFSQHESEDTG